MNNTVQEASKGRWALNIKNASGSNTVRNNILLNDHHAFRGAIDISPDSLSGFTSDYNIVISRFTTDDADTILSLPQWQAQTGNDLHSLVGSAAELFVNAAAGDYHLRASASAIDAGTSQFAPLLDLDGQPRPVGRGFDIGAYEFGSTTLAGDYNSDGTVDAADYIIWRNTLGQNVAPGSGADGNGDGLIGSADYGVWRANFARTMAGATFTVPEPEGITVLWAAIASGAIIFRRPRSKGVNAVDRALILGGGRCIASADLSS